MVVDDLYGEGTPRNRAELPFDLSKVMAEALESLYKEHSKPSDFVPEGLFREITKTLNFAISDDFRGEEPQLCELLEKNNEVFAAFKVHDQSKRMAALMTDEEGRLKSFSDWVKEAEPISRHHNKVWLRTEYDTAVKRAHHAQQWTQFEREKDVLPNLRWVPSTAANPGADHITYWDTVLPIDHPFWSAHHPGDRWGCQCSLEATDEPPTEVPQGGLRDEPAPGLDNNPAKSGELFSKTHPYFPKNCNECPFGTGQNFSAPRNKRDRNCVECQSRPMCNVSGMSVANSQKEYNSFGKEWRKDYINSENGGYLVVHSDRVGKSRKNKQETSKYDKEYSMSLNLAKAGYRVRMLKDGINQIGDCDITVNDILADLKQINSSGNIRTYASETFRKKAGKIVVYEINGDYSHCVSNINAINLRKGQKIMYYFKNKPDEIIVLSK